MNNMKATEKIKEFIKTYETSRITIHHHSICLTHYKHSVTIHKGECIKYNFNGGDAFPSMIFKYESKYDRFERMENNLNKGRMENRNWLDRLLGNPPIDDGLTTYYSLDEVNYLFNYYVKKHNKFVKKQNDERTLLLNKLGINKDELNTLKELLKNSY